jgi:hypothetical protein
VIVRHVAPKIILGQSGMGLPGNLAGQEREEKDRKGKFPSHCVLFDDQEGARNFLAGAFDLSVGRIPDHLAVNDKVVSVFAGLNLESDAPAVICALLHGLGTPLAELARNRHAFGDGIAVRKEKRLGSLC